MRVKACGVQSWKIWGWGFGLRVVSSRLAEINECVEGPMHTFYCISCKAEKNWKAERQAKIFTATSFFWLRSE